MSPGRSSRLGSLDVTTRCRLGSYRGKLSAGHMARIIEGNMASGNNGTKVTCDLCLSVS